jgi:hypothetical protein
MTHPTQNPESTRREIVMALEERYANSGIPLDPWMMALARSLTRRRILTAIAHFEKMIIEYDAACAQAGDPLPDPQTRIEQRSINACRFELELRDQVKRGRRTSPDGPERERSKPARATATRIRR